MIRLGVTGTDTGVGKTVVSCALAAGFRRRGLRVAAVKPIETGVTHDDPERDGARLARAAGSLHPLSVSAPLVFPDPVAPMAAARRTKSSVDLALLDHALRSASVDADALIVEGAGGLLVPIDPRTSYDTLFARWRLDVVIVAANKLGVINHTRLTVRAVRAAGLRVSMVVLNHATQETDTSANENASIIAELEGVTVVELPWQRNTGDLDRASTLLLEPFADELERTGRQSARR